MTLGDPSDPDFTISTITRYDEVNVNAVPDSLFKIPDQEGRMKMRFKLVYLFIVVSF